MKPTTIPLSAPEIGGNEWHYVKECLDTGWISSVGAYVDKFESQIARATQRRFAIATTNGTAALHTALLVAGVTAGDEVIVSALSFIAPANAIRYVGGHPVFIDSNDQAQMDIGHLKHFLSSGCIFSKEGLINKNSKRRVTAILPVHVLGGVGDMVSLTDLAETYGLKLIVDASESLGSSFNGRPAASFGHLSCISFNGNKILSTGGGGMLLTDDAPSASMAKYLTTQAKDDPFESVHHRVGYNYRLPNVLAAIGCAQLERLAEFVTRKREVRDKYEQAFGRADNFSLVPNGPNVASNCWLNCLRLHENIHHKSRLWMRELQDFGIECRPLWQPLHLSPAHSRAEFIGEPSANAVQLYRSSICLPSSPGLTAGEQDRVIEALWALNHRDSLSQSRVPLRA